MELSGKIKIVTLCCHLHFILKGEEILFFNTRKLVWFFLCLMQTLISGVMQALLLVCYNSVFRRCRIDTKMNIPCNPLQYCQRYCPVEKHPRPRPGSSRLAPPCSPPAARRQVCIFYGVEETDCKIRGACFLDT